MDTKQLGTLMGVVRTGVGAAMVVAPSWAGRIWVGDDADGHGTKVFARALGARDVALGAGILGASIAGDQRHAVQLIRLGTAADLADLVATLIAIRNLEGSRRIVMPLVAAGVGLMGVAASLLIEPEDPAQRDDTAAEEAGVVDQQGVVLDQLRGDGQLTDARA